MKSFIKYLLFIIIVFVILHSLGVLTNLNTTFSNGFSFKKFDAVKTGMRVYEVYQIIGSPLVPKSKDSICEYYSREKNDLLSGFLGWRKVGVCYDPVGKVSETQNKIFFK